MRDPVPLERLPSREREVACAVRACGEASAEEVRRALTCDLSSSAVRSMLRRLERKGTVVRRRVGRKFVYRLAKPDTIGLARLVRQFASVHFGGSLSGMEAFVASLASHPDMRKLPITAGSGAFQEMVAEL